MAQRSNHYEAAFEEFLRQRRTPHVVVDETRRALLQQASLKSMDFIVYSSRKPNLLVDIKGRRFPTGGESTQHKWENWATVDDIDSLVTWQQVFGAEFRALLVFSYHVIASDWLNDVHDPFTFREKTYSFYGIWADAYRDGMRTRSKSWETVSLPSQAFRDQKLPIEEFL